MTSFGLKYRIIYALVILIYLAGCAKGFKYADSPYGDGVSPTIKFLKSTAFPSVAGAGDTVSFFVSGVPRDLSGVKIFMNQVEAKVASVQDSLLNIIVPDNSTSGPLEISLNDGQYFIGPVVNIVGAISVSKAFDVGAGTNGPINQIFVSPDRSYVMVGSFDSYNGHPANSEEFADNIADINATNGNFINTFNPKMKGSVGAINSICYTTAGNFMIGGSMTGFSDKTTSIISNITRLNYNGSLDTSLVNKISTDPTEDYYVDTVPTFATGLLGGSVTKIFRDPVADSMLIVLGSFSTYNQYDYQSSTQRADAFYSVPVTQMCRLYPDGSLDSTFNYVPGNGKSNIGLNANISDAIQLSDKSIIIVGNFTSFNGQTVNRIAKLSNDGTADLSFNSGGSGANRTIAKITYNATTNKIMIIGDFTTYNGVACNGVAMLNADGSLDDTFKLQSLGSGYVNFAGQMNNGLLIVSGTFSKYQGFVRQGFMILNPDGTLATKSLNTTGSFVGKINGFIESVTELGLPAVTIYGDFSIFDNKNYGNIVRFQFDE